MRGSLYKTFCLLAIIGLFVLPGSANHILGGYMRLEYVSGNQYRLSLHVYRDCNPASTGFNKDPLQVGFFNKATHQVIDTLFLTTDTTKRLSFDDVPCKVPASNVCIEARTYSTLVMLDPATYPDNGQGYYFSWERGTRDGGTLNIQNANNSGMAFVLEFTHHALLNRNTSPNLTSDPYTIACNAIRYEGNWTIYDKDDDTHTMVLTTPVIGNTNSINTNCDDITCPPPVVLPGPYALAAWNPGYSNTAQVPGTPPLQVINNRAYLTANQVGLYSIAFQVTDSRNGQLLSSYNLELMFRVSNLCPFNQSPAAISPAAVIDTAVKAGKDFCFNYEFQDADNTQQLGYRLVTNVPEAFYRNTTEQSGGSLKGNFCLINTCDLPTDDSLFVRIIAGDNGCPKSDSAEVAYHIKMENEKLDLRSLPNVFTPNGDKINDTYYIPGLAPECIKSFSFYVYNRWGQEVFQSNAADFVWDGGNYPAGAYYYVIYLNGEASNGSITLLRN